MERSPPWWPRGGLWRHPDFLRLWGAQVGSALGSRITRTALPIIAILSIRATPGQVAILSALGVAPGLVVGLLAGGRIDRAAKRPLLVGADLVRALLILSIPAASWLGTLGMGQLYLVAALVGAATTLFQIADNSYLPTLVGPDRLVEGNAKLEATESVAEAAGPGLAGILVQLLTAPVALVIDAATYLWSALLLARIRTPEPPATPGEPPTLLGDIRSGFRACAGDPLVGPTLLAESITYAFGGVFLALYMVVALDALTLSPATAGLIIGAGGIGAFAGALAAEPLARWMGTGRALAMSLAAGQAANLCIPLALVFPRLAIPLLVLQQLVGDAFLAAYAVHAISLRQRTLPASLLGRANATFHVVTGLALPTGALLGGLLADRLGLAPAVWIAAIGGLLAAPVLLASAVVRAR